MNSELKVFRYPFGVRIGYPISFLTWLLAPVLPGVAWYVLGLVEGVRYPITFSRYFDHPAVIIVIVPVWLWAVYMLYRADQSRSQIAISEGALRSLSFLGKTQINWDQVTEIRKRKQKYKGYHLNTFFIFSSSKMITFSDGILSSNELVRIIENNAKRREIPMYLEDYSLRPIIKRPIASLSQTES